MCNNYDAMVFFESKDNFHWLEITKVSDDASRLAAIEVGDPGR